VDRFSLSQLFLQELKFILDQFQRPLLSIFVQTWQHLMTPPAPDVARMAVLLETANLCTKVFYDLNSVDLPEFFEDHMKVGAQKQKKKKKGGGGGFFWFSHVSSLF
jgi:hypothetical protein